MNAFLTGSQAYGTPREDSDTDIVVLVDQTTFDALCDLDPDDEPPKSGGNDVSASLRVGKLNLIMHTSPNAFNAWREGTDELMARFRASGPVSREEAVRVLKEQFRKHNVSQTRACP